MNTRKRKRRRRRKNRLQQCCKGIVKVCIIFILGCLGYALFYTLRPVSPAKPELAAEISQVARYYEEQHIADEPHETSIETESFDMPGAEVVHTEESADEAGTDVQQTQENEWERERRALINGVLLNPQYPGSRDLANVLDNLMPEITGGCEDTYDKVKACYTYLVENCSFSQTVIYDYEYDAYLLLTEKKGGCTYYAAAFHYMMLYLGLEDELISSYRNLESGPSFHRWNEIRIGGTAYIFDAQWEDTLARHTELQYVRFFKTYQELEGLYQTK